MIQLNVSKEIKDRLETWATKIMTHNKRAVSNDEILKFLLDLADEIEKLKEEQEIA